MAGIHIDADMRRDALAVERFATGRIPAKDRKPHPIAAADLKVGGSENIASGLRAHDRREVMLGGKAGYHLRRAVSPFIYKQDNLPMEWLRPQALRHEHNRLVPESEAPQRYYSLDFVSRHGNLRKALPVVPATQALRCQTVSNWDLPGTHVARQPREAEAAADIPAKVDDEAIGATVL